MAHLIHTIHGRPNTCPIGSFYKENGGPARVTATNVRDMLRECAKDMGLLRQGYSLHRIGTHSLRSGGAVRLKLAGYDEAMIKKLGRWSSDTYLIYIQTQVANVSMGVSARMAQPMQFQMLG